MKKCPFCAEEILDEAIKCKFCGSMLNGSETTPGTLVNAPIVSAGQPSIGQPAVGQPVAAEQALQYSHSGQRFLLGYATSFYGIWDRADPSVAVQRFPRTDEGWRQAWATYSAWEPNNADVGLVSSASGSRTYAPAQYAGAGMGAPVTPKTNNMAIWSLALSIIFLIVLGILEIIPIILGYQARKEIKASGGYQTGSGMALAGIVLGWVGLVGWVLIVINIANN